MIQLDDLVARNCNKYEYEVTFNDDVVAPAVTLNQETSQLTIFYDDDIVLSGATEQTFQVTVTLRKIRRRRMEAIEDGEDMTRELRSWNRSSRN